MFMKLLFICLVLLPMLMWAVEPPAGTPTTKVLRYQHDGGLEYWLYQNQQTAAGHKPPLLIFLHGKGETSMASLLKWGPPKHAEQGKEFPGIVVAPLSPNGEWWRNDRLIVFVDSIAKKYDVDLHRIYITGLSMGGFATWNVATHYPGRFAAMVPICGGGNPALAAAIKDMPCWVFHGSLDRVVRQEASDDMVNALKQLGSAVRYTVYPQEAHACWIRTYANEELYTWIYAQRRETAADIDPHAALKHRLRTGIAVAVTPRLLDKTDVQTKRLRLQWTNQTAYSALLTAVLDSGAILHANVDKEPLLIRAGESLEQIVQLEGLKTEPTDYGPLHLQWSIQYQHDEIKDQLFKQAYVFRVTPIYDLKKQAIRIDGDLRDWSSAWIVVDKAAERLRADKDAVDTQCRFKFQLAYDEQFIYVAVLVTDDVCLFNPRKNVWDQDGVELRLDARPQEQRQTYVDWQDYLPFLLSPQPEGGFTVWNQKQLPPGTQMDAQIRMGHYTVEMAIPIAYVEQRAGKDWKRLRINLAVNDFDQLDKRGPQLWWYPDWRGSTDSRLEGTFERVP